MDNKPPPEDIAGRELVPYAAFERDIALLVLNQHVPKQESAVANKLMTWINVPIWRNRHILHARSAAEGALGKTWRAVHIDIEMEEIEGAALLAALDNVIREPVIFLQGFAHIVFVNGMWLIRFKHHGFNRYLLESQIMQSFDVLCKVTDGVVAVQ